MTKISVPFVHFVFFVMLFCSSCSPVAVEEPPSSAVPTAVPETAPETTATDVDPVPSIPDVLDPAWANLPLPPTPGPLPIESLPTRSATGEAVYFPQVAATGNVLEEPGAVWGAGFRNGLPALLDDEVPVGEYGPRSFARVVHMHDPSEFPPFLESGQTLVIHLPAFPPDVYQLNVFTTGDDLKEKSKVVNKGLGRLRNLLIRCNDRRIWQRTYSPFAAEIHALLDPALLRPDGNLVTIENRGTQAVPLDAIRIHPLRPGTEPIFVALDQAQGLPVEEVGWVRTVRLDLPLNTTKIKPLPDFRFPRRKAPKTLEDSLAAWPQVEARYRELVAMEHPHVELARTWIPQVRDALDSGMMPIIGITSYPWSKDLWVLPFLFGDVAGAWQLQVASYETYLMDQLLDNIEDAPLLATPPKYPKNKTGTYPLAYVHYFGGKYPEYGELLRYYFSGKDPVTLVTHFRNSFHKLHPREQDIHSQGDQGAQGEHTLRNAVEFLALTGRGIFVAWGQMGGVFFPDGTGRPSMPWVSARPLFRFGGLESRASRANIVLESDSGYFFYPYWAVADNGRDRVEVLVALPQGEYGTNLTLDLPLPWSGPTRILRHGVIPDWRTLRMPETVTETVMAEATPLPAVEGSPYRGWLRHSFPWNRIMLLELRPADAPPERRIVRRAPEPITKNRIPDRRNMFQVSETPPPGWWSRESLLETTDVQARFLGPVEFTKRHPTLPGTMPDWKPFVDFHKALPTEVKGATPLSDVSNSFRFLENPLQVPQVIHFFLRPQVLPRSEAVGMWIRAHAPPGTSPRFDGFRSRPHTRFWVGNNEGRQLVEIPYGAWCFVGGSASFWQVTGISYTQLPRKGLQFWPDETLELQPVLELNSFDAYNVSLEKGLESTGRTLGFVQERQDGTMIVLVVGYPGKGSFWRQRLERFVDPARFAHVEDDTLRVSAPSPKDPPPEEVLFRIQGEPNAKLLEFHIPAMPKTPSGAYRERIREHFPLIAYRLEQEALSAVLFEETPKQESKTP